MEKLLQIDEGNKSLIEEFQRTAGSSLKTFRYFESRPVDIIQQHLITYIMTGESGEIIGYGHLDLEDNVVWLGICIVETQLRSGYGKKMMKALIAFADNNSVQTITLSVDKKNEAAYALYKSLGFQRTGHDKTVYFMKLELGETDG